MDSRLLLRRPERVPPKVVYPLVLVLFQYVKSKIQLKSHFCCTIDPWTLAVPFFCASKNVLTVPSLGRWQDFGKI